MKDKIKVGYLVTARLKSTRLPRKLLLEIKGKSVVSHMLDRLKLAKNVDENIIETLAPFVSSIENIIDGNKISLTQTWNQFSERVNFTNGEKKTPNSLFIILLLI